MPASAMLHRLTLATRHLHATADADRMAILEFPSRARYRLYLSRIYGFEAPLDNAYAAAPGMPLQFVRDRCKVNRLANDLLTLGLTGSEFAQLSKRFEAPRFSSIAEALGWIYVVERNTLHNVPLRRELARALPREIELAGTYLTAYDDEVGVRWRELGSFLDLVAHSPATGDRIIAAALAAFEHQHAWLVDTIPAPMRIAPIRLSG